MSRFPLQIKVVNDVEHVADAKGRIIYNHQLIEAVNALHDLLEQLEGVGIYMPGEDEGQWGGAEGLSFNRAEFALLLTDAFDIKRPIDANRRSE